MWQYRLHQVRQNPQWDTTLPLSCLPENLYPLSQKPRPHAPEGGSYRGGTARKNFPKRHRPLSEGVPPDDSQHSQKNAARIEERISQGKIALVPAPPHDVIEIDEICIRLSPSFWVWVAVSRLVGQVLGFVFGDRTDAMLPLLWQDVPTDYRDKPVYTDQWGAYARLFPPAQHHPSPKGSGATSHSEGWNTKWRQRQSGLVRKSCGVYAGIEQDMVDRFLLLVEGHNRDCARRWCRKQPSSEATTPLNP